MIDGVRHSGDDRIGIPYLSSNKSHLCNEMITVSLDQVKSSSCILFYVSCHQGSHFKDCQLVRVQVRRDDDTTIDDEEHGDEKRTVGDHVFVHESMLNSEKSPKHNAIVPYLFLYNREQDAWRLHVLNEWIIDRHFLDGFANVLSSSVLPYQIYRTLCDRLEHKVLETFNKEQRLLKKHRAVNRKKKTANAGVQPELKPHEDRRHIMRETIVNEIRDMINPDKLPYVLDPLTEPIIKNPRNRKLVNEYLKKMEEMSDASHMTSHAATNAVEDQQDQYDDEKSDSNNDETTDDQSHAPDLSNNNASNLSLSPYVNDYLELGLGWDTKQDQLHSQFFLSANMVMFGKYGHKISFVDQRSSSKVSGCTYYPKDYKRKGGRTDRALAVQLGEIEKNVTSIILVVVANSTSEFHGFSDLRNPYVRLSTRNGVELFKYGLPDAATISGSKFYSLITLKMTRMGSDDWTLVPIGELSEGSHGLFHPKLRSQIAKYIDKNPEPVQIPLLSSFEIDSGIEDSAKKESFAITPDMDITNIGIDFTCIKNLKDISCYEFGQYGEVRHTKVINVKEKQDLNQRKMSIQLSDMSFAGSDKETPEMLISATSFLRYNLEKLQADKVHHVVWVATFKEWIEDDPLDDDRYIIEQEWSNVIRAWNISDRNALSSCQLSNVYNVDGTTDYSVDTNGTLLAQLTLTENNTWTFKCDDQNIFFKSPSGRLSDARRIKQTRFVRSVSKYLNIAESPSVKQLYGNTDSSTVSASTNIDCLDLLVGVGVEKSKSNHVLELNVELYNPCGSFLCDLDCHSDKFKTLQYYPFRQLMTAHGTDDEQFGIIRTGKTSPIRYYAITVRARSRSYLSAADTVYVRFCEKQTCKEICRVNCEGSVFIGTNPASKVNMDEVPNVFDFSDDEASEYEQENPSEFVLLALLTYTANGWNITPAGRFVSEEQFYRCFIPPAPTHVRIEVLEATVYGQTTTLNPYIKLKMKSQTKKKKKQSFSTKTHNKTSNPVFNEVFDFVVDSPDEVFSLQMLNHDGPLKMRHPLLAAVSFTVSDALSNELEGRPVSLPIFDVSRSKIAEIKIHTSRLWK